MTQLEQINKDRQELEVKLTQLVNAFQEKHNAIGAYSSTGLTIRISHNERSMSGGKHSVYINLSF
jgi:hypothetical protein